MSLLAPPGSLGLFPPEFVPLLRLDTGLVLEYVLIWCLDHPVLVQAVVEHLLPIGWRSSGAPCDSGFAAPCFHRPHHLSCRRRRFREPSGTRPGILAWRSTTISRK